MRTYKSDRCVASSIPPSSPFAARRPVAKVNVAIFLKCRGNCFSDAVARLCVRGRMRLGSVPTTEQLQGA